VNWYRSTVKDEGGLIRRDGSGNEVKDLRGVELRGVASIRCGR
jgi:hypothetical protein